MKKLKMVYLEACDGPRIFIYGSADAKFEYLSQLFGFMASAPLNTQVELHKVNFLETIGPIGVTMKRTNIQRGLTYSQDKSNLQYFLWEWASKAWAYMEDIVDSVIKCDTPTHRYLSNFPREDAIVIVSKGEYNDGFPCFSMPRQQTTDNKKMNIDKIHVAFYKSLDGPEIFFWEGNVSNFRQLQNTLKLLSRETLSHVNLGSIPCFQTHNVSLSLRNIGSMFNIPIYPYQGLKKNVQEKNIYETFLWSRSSEGWDYTAELIDPFIHDESEGHIYLTSLKYDDAIVVLSKGEKYYRDLVKPGIIQGISSELKKPIFDQISNDESE